MVCYAGFFLAPAEDSILGIFHEQTAGSPGSCNSDSGLKQLWLLLLKFHVTPSYWKEEKENNRVKLVGHKDLLQIHIGQNLCVFFLLNLWLSKCGCAKRTFLFNSAPDQCDPANPGCLRLIQNFHRRLPTDTTGHSRGDSRVTDCCKQCNTV